MRRKNHFEPALEQVRLVLGEVPDQGRIRSLSKAALDGEFVSYGLTVFLVDLQDQLQNEVN